MNAGQQPILPAAADAAIRTDEPIRERELERFHDAIERLNRLPATWRGLDPTSIAEDVLETLLDLLELDLIGLRFSDTEHIFMRMSETCRAGQSPDSILAALDGQLEGISERKAVKLPLGDELLSLLPIPLGDIAGMGLLMAGSRRPGFPRRTELAILDVAAAHASTACREVRELSDRQAPADMRSDKPTGEALAESEWRLNLAINSVPAMIWSSTPDGMVDFCNQHLLDFVGLPFEEIMGLGFYRIYHPDDLTHILPAWQEIMATKRGQEVDGRIRRGDGEYQWFTLRQNPLLDGDGNVLKWYGAIIDIEDRKRAEDALKDAQSALVASEQNLNLIINSLPVLIWSARPDGSADFINQRWLEYAGHPAEQILDWGFLNLYHPDDVPGMLEIWKRDLESGNETRLKGRILGADGTYRWFYFGGSKLTDANGVVRWFGANIDIEELQRAEDALKASEAALLESERQLQQIVSSIPGLAWSSDTQGATTFWSQQYLDYAGLRSEDVLGWGFLGHIHPDDRDHMEQVWAATLQSGCPGEAEIRLRRADGQFRWFLVRASPFYDAAGTLTQWFGVNVDIENRKRAEEDLRQSQIELAHVTRMMTMDELAVSIAHEVNQPLMAIVTNAGTCLRWLDDGQLNVALAREAAERIVRDGHRAGEIVTSIRALARKAAIKIDRIGLEQVIQDVLTLLRGELRRRHVFAKTEFARNRTEIRGDSTQLQQVILNLIMNGVEAMEQIDGAHRSLTIRVDAEGDHACVSVTDTGVGVKAGDQERIFEAFFSTKSEGIGMGLSICRSIVEAHGGRVWAAHNPPQGSIFSFTLPLAAGEIVDVPAI